MRWWWFFSLVFACVPGQSPTRQWYNILREYVEHLKSIPCFCTNAWWYVCFHGLCLDYTCLKCLAGVNEIHETALHLYIAVNLVYHLMLWILCTIWCCESRVPFDAVKLVYHLMLWISFHKLQKNPWITVLSFCRTGICYPRKRTTMQSCIMLLRRMILDAWNVFWLAHAGEKLTACSAVLPVPVARLAVASASSKNATASVFPKYAAKC